MEPAPKTAQAPLQSIGREGRHLGKGSNAEVAQVSHQLGQFFNIKAISPAFQLGAAARAQARPFAIAIARARRARLAAVELQQHRERERLYKGGLATWGNIEDTLTPVLAAHESSQL